MKDNDWKASLAGAAVSATVMVALYMIYIWASVR